MTARPAPLAAVPSEPQPTGCERCKANAKVVKELRAAVRELTERNERLVRAVQRESYHFDERVIRNK